MQRYSRIAIFLHWAIAFAIAFQISLGWGLETLGNNGFAMFQLHKSVGITILVLTLARIAVRLTKPRPAPTEGGWEGALAKLMHFGLYAFMLLAPLTGWALVSTAKVKIPTLIFGTIPLPHLPLEGMPHELFEKAHGLLAVLAVLLVLLHVVGAIRHHLLLRDGLIWRMVPSRSVALMWALLLLAPVGLVLGKMVLPGKAVAEPAAVTENAVEAVENSAAVDGAAPVANESAGNAVAAVENATEAVAPAGPPPVWAVKSGGRLGFGVDNGGYAIKGGFSRWTAKIVMDPDYPESADMRVEIDLSSASVGDPTQDAMLPNDEFFGVSAHPVAIFQAKGAEKSGANGYRARGTLTLKGKSAPQSIRFTLTGTGLKRTVTGSASIARKAFDVGNGDSSADMAPNVAVDFRFEATGKAP